MERAWRAIPLAITVFALSFIGWMIHMLRLAWTRNDSWGFTVTVASVVIPIFLVYLWLAIHVLLGIAREGRAPAGEGGPSSDGRHGGLAAMPPGREGQR